ncbi:hypothetical protein K440DRAFT_637912 [Wilcoxina mikolae CBS 423.85]|nr:hypothetical protein K440DRAFT_637912 [Wilcoxina mikolae CBS 423.85]
MLLVKAYDLSMSWELGADVLAEIHELFKKFVLQFEALYVDYVPDNDDSDDNSPKELDPARMVLLTSKIHALLHMCDQLKDCGPMHCMWEWLTETYRGLLKLQTKSRVKPDENLGKKVEIEELLKVAHLARKDFDLEDNIASLDLPEQITHGYETDCGFLLPKASE